MNSKMKHLLRSQRRQFGQRGVVLWRTEFRGQIHDYVVLADRFVPLEDWRRRKRLRTQGAILKLRWVAVVS